MPARFRHFAINVDDVSRARHSHEQAFGWTFDSWGPADSNQIRNAGQSFLGRCKAGANSSPVCAWLDLRRAWA